MNRTITGLLTLSLLLAPIEVGAVPLTLETGVSYQQQQNRPCVIGNPSCHNPAGFEFTLIPVGTSAGKSKLARNRRVPRKATLPGWRT